MVWRLSRVCRFYSKVSDVQVYPPGADVKRVQIDMDATHRRILDSNPLVLPTILEYAGTGFSSVGRRSVAAAAPEQPPQ